ncbi:alternative ribosome rescue aminoacyl-tRNA hydrolase ArfB [Salegentibacter sediminis]|uniref:alternative ribosome rescue aminoacyl-tRNA hydrolase ArfB n=1 Tax=Salegentibacter sediminis TaxID=1930251 RepID=UPI0009BD0B46|nr:alternative ribosome rescue aminoacyl-tRNA hydrolase ArfB [Salegentibacter sediminis]
MDEERIIHELKFKAVRSSGAGGQHVNKTSSKVELHFPVEFSEALSEEEKTRILRKLANRITGAGELVLQSDTSRSQHKNKEDVILRFLNLIKDALRKRKPRKKTKPSRAAREKRLKKKKIQAEKKAGRKNPLQ